MAQSGKSDPSPTTEGPGAAAAASALAAASGMPGGVWAASAALGQPVSGVVKRIKWEKTEWTCEDMVICVYRCTKGVKTLFDGIDVDKVAIKADPDYLEMAAPPTREGEAWRVRVKVKEGVTVSPRWSPQAGPPPEFFISKKNNPRDEPPRAKVQVKVTVYCPLAMALSATAAATAAAGMIPGGPAVVSAALGGGGPVLSKDVIYEVVPPRIHWNAEQEPENPVRLCGPNGMPVKGDPLAYAPEPVELSADPEVIRLRSDPLPPGWNDSILVGGALNDKSNALEIVANKFAGDPEPKVEVLSALLKIASNKLILKHVDSMEEPHTPTPMKNIEWVVQTYTRHLGNQVETVTLSSLPLEMCCYFCSVPVADHVAHPARTFPWTNQSKVGLVPNKRAADPPDTSEMQLRLKSLADWHMPAAHWYFPEEFAALNPPLGGDAPRDKTLDHKLRSPADATAFYVGPTKKSWEDNTKPEDVEVICVVGPDNEDKPVGMGHDKDLYFSAVLKEKISLAGPRVAVLKITVVPTNAKKKDDIDLNDASYYEQGLTKSFKVNIQY
jgi:hypothetical protein